MVLEYTGSAWTTLAFTTASSTTSKAMTGSRTRAWLPNWGINTPPFPLSIVSFLAQQQMFKPHFWCRDSLLCLPRRAIVSTPDLPQDSPVGHDVSQHPSSPAEYWKCCSLQTPPVGHDVSQHPSFPNWAHSCCNIQYPAPDIPEVFPVEHPVLQHPNHHVHLLERHRLQLANNTPVPDLSIRPRSNTPAPSPRYRRKYGDTPRIKPRTHHLLPCTGERPHQQRKSHRLTRKSHQYVHYC